MRRCPQPPAWPASRSTRSVHSAPSVPTHLGVDRGAGLGELDVSPGLLLDAVHVHGAPAQEGACSAAQHSASSLNALAPRDAEPTAPSLRCAARRGAVRGRVEKPSFAGRTRLSSAQCHMRPGHCSTVPRGPAWDTRKWPLPEPAASCCRPQHRASKVRCTALCRGAPRWPASTACTLQRPAQTGLLPPHSPTVLLGTMNLNCGRREFGTRLGVSAAARTAHIGTPARTQRALQSQHNWCLAPHRPDIGRR